MAPGPDPTPPDDAPRRAAAVVARSLRLHERVELVRSGTNDVYRAGGTVLRVTSGDADVASQVALAGWLAAVGIPALRPIAGPVAIDRLQVTAWAYVESRRPVDYEGLGRAIAALHALAPDRVAEHVALPWCGDATWLQMAEHLDAAEPLGVVGEDDIAVLRSVVQELTGWQEVARREPLVVCHGDVHPQNVVMRDDDVIVLDWDSICLGPAAWDHAALLTWAERWGGDVDDYDAFAAGYGADHRGSPVAQLLARVRLLAPTVNMIAKGARSPRHAAEARLRMRYWRGEPSAPTWTPQ